MLGWFQPRCHAGILQFPKASFCPFGSAGFLSFCFTIFTKKCQSNCLQVGKLFPTRKFANHGCGDRQFFSQATNQMEKNSRNYKMLGYLHSQATQLFVLVRNSRCLLAELRGNLIQVKTLKIGRSAPCRTVAVRCRRLNIVEKVLWSHGGWMGFFSIHFFLISKEYP